SLVTQSSTDVVLLLVANAYGIACACKNVKNSRTPGSGWPPRHSTPSISSATARIERKSIVIGSEHSWVGHCAKSRCDYNIPLRAWHVPREEGGVRRARVCWRDGANYSKIHGKSSPLSGVQRIFAIG